LSLSCNPFFFLLLSATASSCDFFCLVTSPLLLLLPQQDAGILIGRKQHGAHHKPNFDAVLKPVLLPAAVCVCVTV
jgi:hypothetical protein